MRTTTYSIPENLHDHIKLIQPTTYFSEFQLEGQLEGNGPVAATTSATPIKVPTAYHGQVDASCNSSITISCLQQLYNTVGYVPSTENGNQVAVTGYLGQYANLQDLNQFFAAQRPDAVNSSVNFVLVNGT
jgi:tripeptidyl-peptidase I